MLQAINLQLVGLPLLCVDVSKMTAISLADSSFTSEIGAGAILIGLRRVGCEVIAVQIHTRTSELNIHSGTTGSRGIYIWYSFGWIELCYYAVETSY